MESLPTLPRDGARPHRAHGSMGVLGFRLIIGVTALGAIFCVAATNAADLQRFNLTGSGTLKLDQPVQKSGNVQLKAYLTPRDTTFASLSPVQEGGHFALTARLASASTVCYSDTIFRDDLDGDGF